MAWYKTGTVTVTNGSATVTGAGTAFVGAVLAGQGFAAPDGKIYEIEAVVSATGLTLASPYLGATAAGASYGIIPTIGGLSAFASRLDTLLTAMQGVVDGAGQGKFAAGTPAAPGMRFTADGDTGLTNPAPNQLGMVTGGVLRALLSGTAFNLSVPITGLAVTQSATDTTAGRVSTVGWMGLGGQISGILAPGDDLNNIVTTGWFEIGTGTLNSPLGGQNGICFSMYKSSGRVFQIAYRIAGGFAIDVYSRISYASGPVLWSAWTKSLNQANILGTVSQASGVPTGAVIERGSNANGEYVRFADGLQICTHGLSASASANTTWTFPAAFAAGPRIIPNPNTVAGGAAIFGNTAGITATTVDFNVWNLAGARVANGCNLTAIGRWF